MSAAAAPAALHFVKFRYTFPPGSVPTQEFVEKYVIDTIERIFYKQNVQDITAGYEEMDKIGRPTHPHVHIHFSTLENPAKIRDRFRKHIKNHTTDDRKRCELYSMKEANEEDIEDQTRFFRYPLKQDHAFNDALFKHCAIKTFAFDVATEKTVAHEEYRRIVEFSNRKTERAIRPSTYEKLEEYLTELALSAPTEREICSHIVRFYKENEFDIDFPRMKKQCNSYRANHGLMSEEEIVDIILKTN